MQAWFSSPSRRDRAALCAALLIVLILPSVNSAQQLSIINYTSDNGPPNPTFWAILQDSRSYMWFGTSDGLTRWDGIDFSTFSIKDGLPDVTIRNIHEDQEHNLWIGTDNGIARFNGRSMTRFNEAQEELGIIWSIVEDNLGNIWFGTQKSGVSMWNGREFRSLTTADGLASNNVYSVFADSQHRLWLGHRGQGVSLCEIGENRGLTNCQHLNHESGLPHDVVRAFAEDQRGNIWIGTRGAGLIRWHDGKMDQYTTRDGLAEDDIYSLLVTNDDEIIIGTVRNGITICELPNLERCHTFDMSNGLVDDAVLTLARDHDENIWVGCVSGASQLISTQIESFGLRDGLPHHTVYSLQVDPEGDVWAGTLDGLAHIARPRSGFAMSRVQTWEADSNLPGREMWEMAQSPSGDLWVATEGGLCLFSEGSCREVFTADRGLNNSDLVTVHRARNGDVWVGSIDGVTRITTTTSGAGYSTQSWTVDDGLTGAYVHTISDDQQGNIWIGTEGGLNRWNGEHLQSFTTADGLPGAEVMDIVFCTDGALFMAVTENAVIEAAVPDATATTITTRPATDDHVGFATVILEVSQDELWFGTQSGIVVYDRGTRSIIERIDESAGLPSDEVHTFARNQDDGTIWVASSSGLTRIDADRRPRHLAAPRVTIEHVRSADGQEWRRSFTAPSENAGSTDVEWIDSNEILLEHDFTLLHFDFRVLRFGKFKTTFKTRLLGFQEDWSEPMRVPFKEYTNLDPGDYTFQVSVKTSSSQWSEPSSLNVSVIPAWWQTAWARIGSVLLLVLVTGSAVRWRVARIRQHSLELERAVAERTDDLRRYARAMEEHSHALDRANARILHADRVKSEFLANMSHELRTPLNSVIGFSEILSSKLKEQIGEREWRFLRNISRSGRYLLLLINNLLDLSKIEADRMEIFVEEVKLGTLVEETLRVVQGYAADRKITVDLDIEEDSRTIEVDVPKFNQIMINLLSNAVKFSQSGDQVEVVVRHLDHESSPLQVASYELAVTDHGSGIAEEDRDIIFDMFRQAGPSSNRPAGTGLGLALVQRFVTILGGIVTFESNPNVQTTFRVVLPTHLSGASPVLDYGSTPDENQEAVQRPCILVLERARQRFQELAQYLDEHGFLPVRAADLIDIKRMCEALRPTALFVQLNRTDSHDWSDLAHQLTRRASLALVLAIETDEHGPALLSADACVHDTCSASMLAEIMQIHTYKEPIRIGIGARTPEDREYVMKILEQCHLELEISNILDSSEEAADCDIVVAYPGRASEVSALLVLKQLDPAIPRIILLPKEGLGALVNPHGPNNLSLPDLTREISALQSRNRGSIDTRTPEGGQS